MSYSPYQSPIESRPVPARPIWVYIGLLGVRTRGQALAWIVASGTGAVVSPFAIVFLMVKVQGASAGRAVLYAAVVGVGLLLALLWYWLALRWMDSNDGWSRP